MNAIHRLADGSSVSARTLRLVALFAIAATSANAAGKPRPEPVQRVAKTEKAKNPRVLDSVSSRPASDSTEIVTPVDPARNQAAMNSLIDSLRRAAVLSARRITDSARLRSVPPSRSPDSVRHQETPAPLGTDSLTHAVDSIRHVTDSVQRAVDSARRLDSIATVRRTWVLAIDRTPSTSPIYAERIRERLSIELRRTGRVRLWTGTDTSSRPDGIWSSARSSGAGKLLVASIASDSTGRVAAAARLYDIASGDPIDSTRSDVPDTSLSLGQALAHRLVGSLLPSSRDSACRIDSSRLASALWSVSVQSSQLRDTLPARAVSDSLLAVVRRSPWASPRSFAVSTGCLSPGCMDSLSKSFGATTALRGWLGRQSDSAWVLAARLVRLADGRVTDSVLVAGTEADKLANQALSRIWTPPSSCGAHSSPSISREVWNIRVADDSISRSASQAFLPLVNAAFRARTDRQFLSYPDQAFGSASDSQTLRSWITRQGLVRVSGSDSLWTMSAVVEHRPTGVLDTIVLKRGGPRNRIFPWFARHLAAWGESDGICHSPCRTDSVRRATAVWAVMPDPGIDGSQVRAALVKAFGEQRNGRLDSNLDRSRCTDLACIDSLAWTRSITRSVWPSFSRGKDSTWIFRARIADMASHRWTDSVYYRDTGSAAVFLARCSWALWKAANPSRRCDTCVSTDTLEAALAVAFPSPGDGAWDSLRGMFRDSLARHFSKDGLYQILDTAKTGKWLGDSSSYSRLRCKTGAAFVVRSRLSLEKSGWRVQASLVEIATNRIVSSLDHQDKNRHASRPAELAPWVAGRLMGTETSVSPPSPSWNPPWKKIAKLGIPAVLGIVSVLLHL